MNIKEEIAAGIQSALAGLNLSGNKPVKEEDATKVTAAKADLSSEDHPVLKVVLAAGIDTPEKFSQLATEASAGREALPGARKDAEDAAVAYFGKDAVGLAAAKSLIGNETSVNRLGNLAEQYWAGAPGADRPGKRLSQPTTPTPTAQKAKAAAERGENNAPKNGTDGETALDEAKNRLSGGHNFYAQYNAQKGANKS